MIQIRPSCLPLNLREIPKFVTTSPVDRLMEVIRAGMAPPENGLPFTCSGEQTIVNVDRYDSFLAGQSMKICFHGCLEILTRHTQAHSETYAHIHINLNAYTHTSLSHTRKYTYTLS